MCIWVIVLFVLHVFTCQYNSDEDEAAKLLCEHNANVNTKNGKGATALFIAAVKGHVSVIKVLLQQPDIDVHLEVC